MKRFYITFGVGTVFAGYYLAMEGEEETLRAFCRDHVPGWAGIYSQREFNSKIAKHNLCPLSIVSRLMDEAGVSV